MLDVTLALQNGQSLVLLDVTLAGEDYLERSGQRLEPLAAALARR